MVIKKKTFVVIMVSCFLFLALGPFGFMGPSGEVWAQEKKGDKEAKETKETKQAKDETKDAGKEKKDGADSQKKGNPWEPEITIYASMPLALTSPLSELFGMGLGAHFSTSFSLDPLLPPMPVSIRAGVLGGLSTFDGGVDDFRAASTRIPVIAFGEIDYRIKSPSFTTRLIGRVGQGISLTTASSSYPKDGETVTTQESSSDATLLVGGGIGLAVASMPRLEYQAMFHMVQIFQTLNGTFVDINLGASYRFKEWQ